MPSSNASDELGGIGRFVPVLLPGDGVERVELEELLAPAFEAAVYMPNVTSNPSIRSCFSANSAFLPLTSSSLVDLFVYLLDFREFIEVAGACTAFKSFFEDVVLCKEGMELLCTELSG